MAAVAAGSRVLNGKPCRMTRARCLSFWKATEPRTLLRIDAFVTQVRNNTACVFIKACLCDDTVSHTGLVFVTPFDRDDEDEDGVDVHIIAPDEEQGNGNGNGNETDGSDFETTRWKDSEYRRHYLRAVSLYAPNDFGIN